MADFSAHESEPQPDIHPFDSRNIHPDFPRKVRRLFDDGYFAEATFEAFKWVDKEVRRLSGSHKFGHAMMMDVFNENNAALALTPMIEQSEIDEQLGYRFIFAGSQSAIRNPRGHDTDLDE
ncbi:TIGR02391 family protein [Microbacterium schleiferi]|uniref:TIGR02391 family protein n=1 Tax=Microbacterium schleiferi TaxID=69362 RepID=UPI001D1755E5|nr:TIGR02391 family protein [Microbacterium schleiferi]MCC4268438.1 TIGR02391 family protein [Microbacterium schleiferi]